MPDRVAAFVLWVEATDWLRVLGITLQLVGLLGTLVRRHRRRGADPHKD